MEVRQATEAERTRRQPVTIRKAKAKVRVAMVTAAMATKVISSAV